MMSVGEVKKKIQGLVALVLLVGCVPLLHASRSMWLFTDGGNVSNSWQLETNLDTNFLPIGIYGSYNLWCRSWSMIGEYGTICFTARAMNDIHVGITVVDPWDVTLTDNFYSTLVSNTNFYEIVIGGWANTTSVIRRGSQTDAVAVAYVGVPTSEQSVDYKVIVYKSPKTDKDTIAVYHRDLVDKNKWIKLICYEDPSFITGKKRWVSFSNWDNPIFYTKIEVSTSVTLPWEF